VYEENTRPLIDYYREKGLLRIVDGNRDPDEVFADIAAVLTGGESSIA
jgi:adenylate kinase